MKTYQDLEKVGLEESERKTFIISAINEHKGSEPYKLAEEGVMYDRQENKTIMNYRKMLHTISGKAVPDMYSANYKIASNFYNRINTQTNQYLLGNGVLFNQDGTKDKLGNKRKTFDVAIQDLGMKALTEGVAFGFFNVDHIDVFDLLEFVPLWDEEDGSLKAGIRFWQIDSGKPLRATLYELDGYTDYIKRKNEDMVILNNKRPYKLTVLSTEAGDTEIFNGENYPAFPIVPLWGNKQHICNIKGWRQSIDCYDLIKSGFANDIDDASLIYWTLENAGGMDDIDLAKFIQHMKTVKAAVVDDNIKAEAHTLDVPVTARDTYLSILEKDLIKDAMALDTEALANGNVTATAIRAAYEPLNNKTDGFEYCVIEFIQGILYLAGIEDDPSFKRSTIVNQAEETQMVLSAAQYLDPETILKHLPFISPDEVSSILDNLISEEMSRFEDEVEEDEPVHGETTSEDGEGTE